MTENKTANGVDAAYAAWVAARDLVDSCDVCDCPEWLALVAAMEGEGWPAQSMAFFALTGDDEGYDDLDDKWEMQFHDGYAEHEGEDHEGPVATADWNDVPEWAVKALESFGFETGAWSDETTSCADCNKLVRSSPDSYHWEPAFVSTNDGAVCRACIESDAASLLAEHEGDTGWACPSWIDPSEHGYVNVSDEGARGQDYYETGLHEGQNDRPADVKAALGARGERVVFRHEARGQFDTSWSAWVPSLDDDNEAED